MVFVQRERRLAQQAGDAQQARHAVREYAFAAAFSEVARRHVTRRGVRDAFDHIDGEPSVKDEEQVEPQSVGETLGHACFHIVKHEGESTHVHRDRRFVVRNVGAFDVDIVFFDGLTAPDNVHVLVDGEQHVLHVVEAYRAKCHGGNEAKLERAKAFKGTSRVDYLETARKESVQMVCVTHDGHRHTAVRRCQDHRRSATHWPVLIPRPKHGYDRALHRRHGREDERALKYTRHRADDALFVGGVDPVTLKAVLGENPQVVTLAYRHAPSCLAIVRQIREDAATKTAGSRAPLPLPWHAHRSSS